MSRAEGEIGTIDPSSPLQLRAYDDGLAPSAPGAGKFRLKTTLLNVLTRTLPTLTGVNDAAAGARKV